MVAQRPDSVKDGWVVHVDPIGMAQTETGACAVALATAGKALGRADWSQAAQKAADWAMGQPCLPNFVANAASAGLLARAYLDAKQDRHLVGLARKLNLGLLPGQVENGRWIDASSATTPNHLVDPPGPARRLGGDPGRPRGSPPRPEARASTWRCPACWPNARPSASPRRATPSATCSATATCSGPTSDPRLEPAILDSATVIQELCHEGPKPKLGVAPDQLAALIPDLIERFKADGIHGRSALQRLPIVEISDIKKKGCKDRPVYSWRSSPPADVPPPRGSSDSGRGAGRADWRVGASCRPAGVPRLIVPSENVGLRVTTDCSVGRSRDPGGRFHISNRGGYGRLGSARIYRVPHSIPGLLGRLPRSQAPANRARLPVAARLANRGRDDRGRLGVTGLGRETG